MTVHVALLRGINVTGNNRLPMAALTEMFVAAGCTDVKTYIQSGNVVFAAKDAAAKKVPGVVSAAISKKFRFSVPVVLFTLDEVRAVAKKNPFLKAGKEGERLHIAFLDAAPSKAQVASLDPARSPGDEFAVAGRAVYLSFPNGVGRTKLTNAYLDSKLGTVSTLRNLRTVQALIELGEALEKPKK
jgi:uncharacterized protein (DUF1697 family)